MTTPKSQVFVNIKKTDIKRELSQCQLGKVCFGEMPKRQNCDVSCQKHCQDRQHSRVIYMTRPTA